MNGRSAQVRMLAWLGAMALVAACGRKDKVSEAVMAADSTLDRGAIDSARMQMEAYTSGTPSELSGSTWRLLQLQASHDSVLTPERMVVYTIEFGADGRATVVAGCNRGSGTYTTVPPKGLSFGPFAATRAMCPPGSLSPRFLGDVEKMRSYQIVGRHLYVSVADGAVYEFTPEEELPQAEEANEMPVFVCTDSTGAQSRMSASFNRDAKEVTLASGGKRVVIPQVPSGSGTKYEGSGVMFWNKGRDARVTWKGTNLNCALTLR